MNMPDSNSAIFSSFWPLCLLTLSIVIFFGWQLTIGVQQYIGSLRMIDQQALVVKQAAQTESKLQSMMTDLLFLAKTDAEAQAIVTKYRIKLNTDKSLPRVASPANGAVVSPASSANASDATK